MSERVRSVMRVEKRLLEAVYQLFSEKRQWSRPKRRSNLSRFPPPTPPVEDDIGTVVSHGSSSSVALFCHLPIAEYPIQTLLQLITAVNLPGFVGCPNFFGPGSKSLCRRSSAPPGLCPTLIPLDPFHRYLEAHLVAIFEPVTTSMDTRVNIPEGDPRDIHFIPDITLPRNNHPF